MQIVYKKINEVKPYDKNPRNNDDAVPGVMASIEQFGFKVPCVIDKEGVLITGHTRLKAAKRLGIKEIPCVIADDLSEAQIKAYRLADNKVSEVATWNDDLLKAELDDILDIDMESMGFDIEIEDITEEIETKFHRELTFDAYNLSDVDMGMLTEKGMPILRKTDHIPKDLLSFNYMLNKNDFKKGIHFYIDDYQFERIWNSPYKYLERMALFDCVLTPDFSTYTDMPLPMQIWNIYRSKMVGQIMQNYGLTVIPTLQWCTEESFPWAFDGIEPGGVVSVSTIGVKTNKDATKIWIAGMDEAIKQLNPSHVVVYGGDIGYKFDCGVTYIANHNTERMRNKG